MRLGKGILITAGLLLATACAGITETTIIESAPPRQELPAVRSAPRASTGKLLFQLRVDTDKVSGGLPSGDLMMEVRRKGAELGATVLVFKCGAAGTIGSNYCTVEGYAE